MPSRDDCLHLRAASQNGRPPKPALKKLTAGRTCLSPTAAAHGVSTRRQSPLTIKTASSPTRRRANRARRVGDGAEPERAEGSAQSVGKRPRSACDKQAVDVARPVETFRGKPHPVTSVRTPPLACEPRGGSSPLIRIAKCPYGGLGHSAQVNPRALRRRSFARPKPEQASRRRARTRGTGTSRWLPA